MTKRVDTTIPDDIWKAAVFNDIPFTKALIVGIKVLSGDGAEEKVAEQISETKKRLEWLEHHYETMLKEKAKLAAARSEWLKDAAASPKSLEIKTRQYNIRFGENNTMKELEELIKNAAKNK